MSFCWGSVLFSFFFFGLVLLFHTERNIFLNCLGRYCSSMVTWVGEYLKKWDLTCVFLQRNIYFKKSGCLTIQGRGFFFAWCFIPKTTGSPRQKHEFLGMGYFLWFNVLIFFSSEHSNFQHLHPQQITVRKKNMKHIKWVVAWVATSKLRDSKTCVLFGMEKNNTFLSFFSQKNIFFGLTLIVIVFDLNVSS